MAVQLPLHIGLRDSATFANYLQADNAQVTEQLRLSAAREGEPFIFIHGSSGTGKTHLLQSVCHAVVEQAQAVYLPLRECQNLSVDILEGLEQMSVICVDDLDAIAGNVEWETALFHLYNRVRDASGRLIMAANENPAALNVNLPDLQSRLSWGLVFKLQSLNDTQLASALQLRATARGLELPTDVANFLLRRTSRNMTDLFNLLEKLDHESLAAKRKLTIPFVRQFV